MSRSATTSNRKGPILAAALVLTGLWAAAASGLLLFHDDVLAAFVSRQGAMQAAYEAQLSELRTRLDRGRSERSQAQDALEARLAGLIERQGELERRQAALAGLAAASPPTESIDPLATGSLPSRVSAPIPGLGLRRGDSTLPGRRGARETSLRLAALDGRMDGLAAAQAMSLDRITERAGRDLGRLRRVIGLTGLDPRRFGAPDAPGLGGPLVPVDASPFATALAAAVRTASDAESLRRVAVSLPLSRPVLADRGVASGFGTRLDPFTRGLALHTGLDLRAEMGEAALATAPGRIVAAEPAGGYGNMVEIDHGHGVVTRFAHLARIAARPGQWVRAGDLVGRVGSTGRSTGTHLHYETRIDGEPVDPQGFLDAGRELEGAAAPQSMSSTFSVAP